MIRRSRVVTAALPARIGRQDGLAYCLWLPSELPGTSGPLGVRLTANIPLHGGVVILHGAGSAKENHHDFARVALAAGFAAVTFDQRGHGESEGPMDGRALDDVVAMAALLRSATGDPRLPIALRGSSMGGYFAIVAAGPTGARAVVAICPAPGEGLVRGLRAGKFSFDADAPSLEALLTSHDLFAAVRSLSAPLLSPPRRGRRAGPGRALPRAHRERQVAREPPDRAARRPPPLDPAR